MTPLRQRMIDAMVLRGFAARTQETYLTAVGQLARHHHRSPDLLSPAVKTVRMAAPRAALAVPAPNAQAQEDAAAFLKRVAGIDVACCPLCRIGRWRTIELLPASQSTRQDLDLQCRGPP